MKIKLSFRASIITLFIVVFGLSSYVLNNFFTHQQENTALAFDNIQFDESLIQLEFSTEADSIRAHRLINRYRQSLASIKLNMNETKIYSSTLLLMILVATIAVFMTLFNLIIRPFNRMISATESIKQGDFDINLPERGFKEILHLNKSFNQMSTELALTQKKLIETEKLIIWKEISRMLAHEIKNPLTPINLSIQRLEEKYITNQEDLLRIFPEAAETIHQEIRNLQNLARSFSDFARINEPVQSLMKPVESLKEIIKPYRHQYDISLQGDADLEINFDSTHFYQIMTNLVQNSIDACENDCCIKIVFEKIKNKVKISLKDNGSGISEDNLKKIFQPYFSSKAKGTGLGLAVVKRLIDINQAEIFVESEIGSGTEFIIWCLLSNQEE